MSISTASTRTGLPLQMLQKEEQEMTEKGKEEETRKQKRNHQEQKEEMKSHRGKVMLMVRRMG